MTRVSGVDDNFIKNKRRLEEQRHCCGDRKKSDTADTMVGQKSGPALAGPAAPATTAHFQHLVS